MFPRSAIELRGRLPRYRTVFLDRDGTINVKAPSGRYITSPQELCLIPGAAAAISRLNAAEVRVILVTNQRWLSGPDRDLDSYGRVHARLEELLAAEGAHLDAAFCCPHAHGSCGCRKPAPGMLYRAAEEYGLALRLAVMVGDSDSDVAAGQAAGTQTILVNARCPVSLDSTAFVLKDLAEAVDLILSDEAGGR